jgi:hypothetical protein
LQKGDVVFLGTVTAVENVLPEAPASAATEGPKPGAPGDNSVAGTAEENTSAAPPSSPVTRYHFHIDDRFGGPDAAEIDVFSGGDDGDCGYRFKTGE